MRVLITGGTGFLGSHLCRYMVAEGHEVRVLGRATSATDALDGLIVERVYGDVTDRRCVLQAVQDRDWVIHAAAKLGDRPDDAAERWQVNVEGTRHVVQACLEQKVQRLLHVSSVVAVGIPDNPAEPANEDFPFNLENGGPSYHASKRQAEEVVWAGVERGLDAVVVNPAFIFGPHGSRYRGAEMLWKVRRSWLVPYFMGGVCAVHVLDVVKGTLATLERGRTGHRYILGGENLPFRALAERTARILNVRRQLVPIPWLVTGLAARALEPWGRWRNVRPGMTYATHRWVNRFHYYDSAKARAGLGYAPRDFDDILHECSSFLSHRPLCGSPRPSISAL
jgi:dihydroflavonol-4-reductase